MRPLLEMGALSEDTEMSQEQTAGVVIGMVLVLVFAPEVGQADEFYWHRTVVDAGGLACGGGCSLAFDPNGNPAITYRDGDGVMALARLNPDDPNEPDGVWVKTLLPPLPDGGSYVRPGTLAFHPNGYPGVTYAYHDPCYGYCLAYAWEDAEGWHDTQAVRIFLGALPPRGRIRLAFESGGRPWLGFGAAGAYMYTLVAWASPLDPADPQGEVGHTEGAWNWYAMQFYATLEGAWTIPSLAIDANDVPAMSYVYPYSPGPNYPKTLMYSWCPYDPPGHRIVFVDPNYVWVDNAVYAWEGGSDPISSLAYDAEGVPGIACFRQKWTGEDWERGIFYIKGSGGGWDVSTVTDQVGSIEEDRPDIWLHYGSDDRPGISYHDNRDPSIKPLVYTYLDPNSVWQFSMVDDRPVRGNAEKGAYNSMVTDPNGRPAITYRDVTFNCLRYAVTADEPDSYTLSTWNEGQGHGTWGTILIDPNMERYPEGTVVTLTGVPSDGKKFVGWRIYDPRHPGDANYAAEDTNNPLQLVMLYDTEVGAAFACADDDALLPAILALLGVTLAVIKIKQSRRRTSARG